MNIVNSKTEKTSFNFWGMKLDVTNPGIKTIIILVIVLIFLLAAVALLKVYVLPAIAAMSSKKIISSIPSKCSSLIKLWKGRSP